MKTDLRNRAKNILLKMDEQQLRHKSTIISSKLSNLFQELTLNSNEILTVGVFSPIKGEVRWFERLNNLANVQFAVAHIVSETEMEFHPVELDLIQSQKIGFKLAKEYLKISIIPKIMLIPGLAFSQQGDRLGRGKGYYDRFLAKYDGLKIGICFEEQITDKIIIDTFDVNMDLVITDKNIYKKER